MVPRDRIFIAFGEFNRPGRSNAIRAHKLPTRNFSDRIFKNSKLFSLQVVDSIIIFYCIFGFVWNCLKNFDLDGHILGKIGKNYGFDSCLMIL